jgi:prephenate dehydrogenase
LIMTVQITILGLGQVGASIGLALAKAKDQVTRVGSDRDPDVSRHAQKLGAVEKIVFNLPSAVENADVVVLALPLEEVYDTLKAVALDLKPGVVVIDTSPAARQTTAWAKELLTEPDRYFLTVTPTFSAQRLLDSDAGLPKADLFQDSLMTLTSPTGTDESAITLAENFVKLLGATPLISDPLEVDGLVSTVRLLPEVLAAALINAGLAQPGWAEARKLAGRPFALAGQTLEEAGSPRSLAQAAQANRENLTRLLDALTLELRDLRAELESDDLAPLQTRLEKAQKGHHTWWGQRWSGKWDANSKTPAMPTAGEVLGRLFGIRPKKSGDK